MICRFCQERFERNRYAQKVCEKQECRRARDRNRLKAWRTMRKLMSRYETILGDKEKVVDSASPLD